MKLALAGLLRWGVIDDGDWETAVKDLQVPGAMKRDVSRTSWEAPQWSISSKMPRTTTNGPSRLAEKLRAFVLRLRMPSMPLATPCRRAFRSHV